MTAPLISHHEWNSKGFTAPYDFVIELSFPEPLPYFANPAAVEHRRQEVQFVIDTARRHGVQLGTCYVCGHHLKYNYVCRDSAGKAFVVGCDCVCKLDDTRLMSAVQIAHERAVKTAERQRKIAAEMRQREEREAAWLAANPDLASAYQHCMHGDNVWPVAQDIARKVREFGSISEKQISILVREFDKFNNPPIKEALTPAPAGRIVITGEVLSFKLVHIPFGFNNTVLKVLVKDDRGFKVFGRLASSIGSANRGDRVTFTATLEQSQDDPSFAFFSRPTKGAVLSSPDQADDSEVEGAL